MTRAGGAQRACTAYAARSPRRKPGRGDLVFFQGTLGEGVDGNDGITHVGMYVGDHKMIHCGNPIGYADLNDAYWRQHFYGYGRVPE